MKRLFLTALAVLLSAASLSAQDTFEAENRKILSSMAAHPAVVAVKRVPRTDFFLWYSHLTDGSWGSDCNWYPQEVERLYLSRPGTEGGSDIVYTELGENGRWSVPQPVCAEAVSAGNEVFPMVSPDGKRLYFASDGLFGMGGYDLYVATWDPVGRTWGHVQNLGVPFNSDADDLLFCDTPDGRYSLLASNRNCGQDSIDIFVLRQEVPVFSAVTSGQARTVSALRVTEPDESYLFVKRMSAPVPVMDFEEPAEGPDGPFRVGKEGAFAQENRLPSGLVYQVQLFVSGNKVGVDKLKGIRPVYVHAQRSGKKLYAAGIFRTYAEAEEALSAVKRTGFPTAFVIAFDGGEPLALSKARKKESSVQVVTEEVHIVR